MSASLVGSEMCIRDSSSASYAFPAPARGAAAPGSPRCSPDGGPLPPWTCLLYTSDAADDM
eukprot:4358004-Alexandrium_andersonii.AAC.1